jgi:hypothetical protein
MMMLNKDKVAIKWILGLHRLVKNPTDEDMLYEIVSFLDTKGTLDQGFTLQDLRNEIYLGKEIKNVIAPLFERLIATGEIESLSEKKVAGMSKIYKIKKHRWN